MISLLAGLLRCQTFGNSNKYLISQISFSSHKPTAIAVTVIAIIELLLPFLNLVAFRLLMKVYFEYGAVAVATPTQFELWAESYNGHRAFVPHMSVQ